ncbi:unnamed protein product [Rhizopus stolonifer]
MVAIPSTDYNVYDYYRPIYEYNNGTVIIGTVMDTLDAETDMGMGTGITTIMDMGTTIQMDTIIDTVLDMINLSIMPQQQVITHIMEHEQIMATPQIITTRLT